MAQHLERHSISKVSILDNRQERKLNLLLFLMQILLFTVSYQIFLTSTKDSSFFFTALSLLLCSIVLTGQYKNEANSYAFGKALLVAPLLLDSAALVFHMPTSVALYLFWFQLFLGLAEQALALAFNTKESPKGLYYFLERGFKRIFDICFATFLLILLLPFLGLISVLVLLETRESPFFLQTRIGLQNKAFKMFKLKTMRSSTTEIVTSNATQNKRLYDCRNDKRITQFGQYLRKLSIDELPQIINVLVGNMSFIGPRPLIPEEHDMVDRVGIRTQVRPGISGLWQVKGRINYERNASSVAQYDEEYIQTWCTYNDLKIFIFTIPVVLFCKGAG